MLRQRATKKNVKSTASTADVAKKTAPIRSLFICACISLTVVLLTVFVLLTAWAVLGHPHASVTVQPSCPASVNELPRSLGATATKIRRAADALPAIAWSQYTASPDKYAGRKVVLHNADFGAGTVRLQTAGLFVLDEDVQFEPNANANWLPERSQAAYGNPAYRLGFFAAITVEADNVVLDLQGHSLVQSDVFALQQRFFALIELSNQPFIHGQGPTAFGEAPVEVHNVIVENGRLGRSAHHGIHGNGGARVLVRNLLVEQYEVAALSLNGFSDTVVQNVEALGSSQAVAVLGTYSNARFLMPSLDRAGAMLAIPSHKREAVQAAKAELEARMAEVLDDVRADGLISEQRHPEAYALFANPTGLCDGNSYGILFHPLGAAVGSFWHESPSGSSRILMDNCTIANTVAHIVEVVALVAEDGRPVRGPVGDVLRIVDNTERPALFAGAQGAYRGNALATAQIALMDAVQSLPVDQRASFGTLHGDEDIVEWARDGDTLEGLIGSGHYHYERNGDTMFHVNKVLAQCFIHDPFLTHHT